MSEQATTAAVPAQRAVPVSSPVAQTVRESPGPNRSPIAPDAVQRIGWILRLVMLVLVGVLVLVTTRDTSATVWVCLLAVAALPAWTQPFNAPLALIGRLAEIVVTALGATTLATSFSGETASALLPYLAVPVVVPALSGGLAESMGLLGLAGVCLVGAGMLDGHFDEPTFALAAAEWVVIAGLSAGFIHAVQRRVPRPLGQPAPPYAEATRLLTQLRTVARRLPGATLDPGGIAEHLIEEARGVASVDRAAVLSGSGGGHLVVLAESGGDRIDWETSLDADSAIAEAWASQLPQVTARSQSRSAAGQEVSSLVLPLVTGVRTVAVLAMETDKAGAFPPAVVARMAMLADSAALRLEAALLFDDVRSLATNEERQRLAREIHDGIAQELVIIGYGIDNAIGSLPDQADESVAELTTLRKEVTRVIEELRLSLFELRSEVDRHGGLTAAVADYARTVGAAGGMRVNLAIEATPARLPATIEAELMRIAQEAINNARRHSRAENLWVTVTIDPPYARIEIADDGRGIGPHRREGRLGLAIMAERAQRIRGQLHISPRVEGGTCVAVVLGSPPLPLGDRRA